MGDFKKYQREILLLSNTIIKIEKRVNKILH